MVIKKLVSLLFLSLIFATGDIWAQNSGETPDTAKQVPPEIAEAIARVDSLGDSIKPITTEKIEWLKKELNKFFTQQIPGQAVAGEDESKIQATIMVGLDYTMGFDSEGRPKGEFISCGNNSGVKMKDGTIYLFYRDQWWELPAQEQKVQ